MCISAFTARFAHWTHTAVICFAYATLRDFFLCLSQDSVGKHKTAPGSLSYSSQDGLYHILHCSSPEYKCSPPFTALRCQPNTDCSYDLSQLRWGLRTVLRLTAEYGLNVTLEHHYGVDQSWWESLIEGGDDGHGLLAWYPVDETGFKLDKNCEFLCPQYVKT